MCVSGEGAIPERLVVGVGEKPPDFGELVYYALVIWKKWFKKCTWGCVSSRQACFSAVHGFLGARGRGVTLLSALNRADLKFDHWSELRFSFALLIKVV